MKALKECLEMAGISNKEAAEIIGRSEKTLLKTLNGKRDFYLHEIIRLQTVLEFRGFNLTLDEMLDPEGAPTN
jgi:plasmid maintenance system antidote protein VapI